MTCSTRDGKHKDIYKELRKLKLNIRKTWRQQTVDQQTAFKLYLRTVPNPPTSINGAAGVWYQLRHNLLQKEQNK